eukprot:scaffold10737_cov133-Isochrysis_galbana.AAC.2
MRPRQHDGEVKQAEVLAVGQDHQPKPKTVPDLDERHLGPRDLVRVPSDQASSALCAALMTGARVVIAMHPLVKLAVLVTGAMQRVKCEVDANVEQQASAEGGAHQRSTVRSGSPYPRFLDPMEERDSDDLR